MRERRITDVTCLLVFKDGYLSPFLVWFSVASAAARADVTVLLYIYTVYIHSIRKVDVAWGQTFSAMIDWIFYKAVECCDFYMLQRKKKLRADFWGYNIGQSVLEHLCWWMFKYSSQQLVYCFYLKKWSINSKILLCWLSYFCQFCTVNYFERVRIVLRRWDDMNKCTNCFSKW